MKRSITCLLIMLSFVSQISLNAQESGKVTYETIVQYNFKTAPGKVEWNAFIADLPKTGTSIHSISFNDQNALFTEDVNHKESAGPKLSRAMDVLNREKGPQVESLSVYYDFDKNRKYEQVEFMTRLFVVESEMEAVAWKITGKMKKVMDYVCMGSELNEGEDTITAWFSSEIPVSAGPGIYRGLPGLILGIEKNGEVVSLASKVDFKDMDNSTFKKPKDGKKVSQKEFDQIVKEKREEFKKAGKANSDRKG